MCPESTPGGGGAGAFFLPVGRVAVPETTGTPPGNHFIHKSHFMALSAAYFLYVFIFSLLKYVLES